MSKTATMNARMKMRNTPPQPAAVAKSGFSTSVKVIAGAGALVLLVGGLVIAAMPGPGTVASLPAGQPATVAPRASGSPASVGALTAMSTKFNFGSVSHGRRQGHPQATGSRTPGPTR